MADPHARLPSERDDALQILLRLRDAGHTAYFAGGCVRDELLGRVPKDYDIATSATPQQVRQQFRNSQLVGAAFGVVLVRLGGSGIEVATFRAEGAYSDGRRPDAVRFTTAEEDARRRDFTINGMFLDPVENRVIDYVGGQEDLRAGRIVAIGNPHERFAEDHLRLLRAVRFAARLNFVIEGETAQAIIANAEKLPRVSPERIADELHAILSPPTRGLAWRLMWELRLVQQVFRGMEWPAPQRLDEAGDLLLRLPDEPCSFPLVLAAGLLSYHLHNAHALADLLTGESVRNDVRASRRLLKLSNDELEAMEDLMLNVAVLLEPHSVARAKRFLAHASAYDTRLLLDAIASAGLHPQRISALQQELDHLLKEPVDPTPYINGDDLAQLGLRPGPIFKRLLDAVYDAQLERRVVSREAAIEMAKELAASAPRAKS